MRSIVKPASVWAIVMASILGSCARIDELSDHNTIAGFRVLSHTPQEMLLGNSEIDGEEINIPIVDGKNNFPLRFCAEPVFNGPIDRISGIDFSKEQTLASQDDRLTFYVMAPSGLTKKYVIRAREIPRDQNNYIFTSFTLHDVDPAGTVVSEQGAYTLQGDTLIVFTVDGSYPLTITPEFTISELSRFTGYAYNDDREIREFVNGSTPLTFDGKESACHIRVESASEDLRVWSIVVRHAPLISGQDGTSTPDQRAPTDIDPRGIAASLPGTDAVRIDEVFTDNLAERIRIVVKAEEGEVAFPLQVGLRFVSMEGVQLIGIRNDDTLTFADWDDVQEFYMLDPQTLTSRLWRVEIAPWRDSGNNVLSFSYEYDAATVNLVQKAIELDRTNVEIYPENGDIYLHMTKVNNALISSTWKLTLKNLQLTVSPGASYTLPSFVWSGNDSWKTPIPFRVTAGDGTEKEWRVHIRDMRNHVASGGCELTAFSITRHTPNYAVFDGFTPVKIDAAQQTVMLKLADDDAAYPLTVWPGYGISPFARVTSQNGGIDPLVFATDESTQTVVVTAEDGTVKEWTVGLETPPREAQADVVDFEATSVSPGVQLGTVSKDNEAGIIRLELNAAVGFPLSVGYSMTVSKKAAASVPLRGTYVFNAYTDVKEFTVTAENKSTRQWKVRLVFEPRLANWNLNSWTSGTVPVSWGTANNSFIKGTNRIDRGSGDYAAELSTNQSLKLASGSLFLGWFDADNALGGLSDPIKLTFFGQEFASSGKLLGMEIDVNYTAGATFISGTNREAASCVIELVKHQPEKGAFVYHGMTTHGVPHSTNTAVAVARGEALLANTAGQSWKETDLVVVPAGQWTTIRVLLDYPGGAMPDYTHLSIVFSSSAQGDRFEGVSGSKLRLDNIRLLYE